MRQLVPQRFTKGLPPLQFFSSFPQTTQRFLQKSDIIFTRSQISGLAEEYSAEALSKMITDKCGEMSKLLSRKYFTEHNELLYLHLFWPISGARVSVQFSIWSGHHQGYTDHDGWVSFGNNNGDLVTGEFYVNGQYFGEHSTYDGDSYSFTIAND